MELLKYINNLKKQTPTSIHSYENMLLDSIQSYFYKHGEDPEYIILVSSEFQNCRRELIQKNGRLTNYFEDNIETFYYHGVGITHNPLINKMIVR